MTELKPEEVVMLQNYMQNKFKNTGFAFKMRENAKDSVEVLLDNEFIGVISKIFEEGETSYNFDMAILDIDLAGSGGR